MYRTFFYEYKKRFAAVSDIAREKNNERNRHVVSNDQDTRGQIEAHNRYLDEQYKIANCYNVGEIERRITLARRSIWYVTALADGDVTKIEAVRQCNLKDAITMLEYLIKYRA